MEEENGHFEVNFNTTTCGTNHINGCNEPIILLSFVLTTLMEPHSSAISSVILNLLYQFEITNSDCQTLKSFDFWCKFSSPFIDAELPERCFELLRKQISQNVPGFCPWNSLGQDCSVPSPRLPSCATVFLFTCQKTGNPAAPPPPKKKKKKK